MFPDFASFFIKCLPIPVAWSVRLDRLIYDPPKNKDRP